MNLFVDSGAPTLYNKWARKVKTGVMGASLKNRKHDDHSYLENEEYLKYRQEYAAFLKEKENKIGIYANLDIINNAEATWKNQLWFENQGLRPMPVWHFGTNISYLERYIDMGYEHLAIGGMIPNSSRTLIGPLDHIWGHVLTDVDGLPKTKVHGFAMTAFMLMRRYPWYSVDSSSWIKVAAYGKVFVPPKGRNGEWAWHKNPNAFVVSEKGRNVGLGKNEHPEYRRQVFALFEEHGFPVGKNRRVNDKTFPMEKGLCNDYLLRAKWNIFHMEMFKKTLKEWPWKFEAERHELL